MCAMGRQLIPPFRESERTQVPEKLAVAWRNFKNPIWIKDTEAEYRGVVGQVRKVDGDSAKDDNNKSSPSGKTVDGVKIVKEAERSISKEEMLSEAKKKPSTQNILLAQRRREKNVNLKLPNTMMDRRNFRSWKCLVTWEMS